MGVEASQVGEGEVGDRGRKKHVSGILLVGMKTFSQYASLISYEHFDRDSVMRTRAERCNGQ